MNNKSNAKIFITIEDITDYITYDEFIDELEKESSNIRSIINRCEKAQRKGGLHRLPLLYALPQGR